jgi:aldehyde:ferredoxin oxidoreductase
MNGGYRGQLLRVDLTKMNCNPEKLKEDWVRDFVGGKGLGVRYLYDLIPAGTDPYSPENPVIFMTGPLTGTVASTMSRIALVTKSPLTGTMSDSYSGSYFPAELKHAGFDGIIITGKASAPTYLFAEDGHAELRNAKDLWGKDVFETTDEIVRRSSGASTAKGDVPKVACIGPAGENRVRFAAVAFDKKHFAGRGGTGAVMGSKNLKAVAVRGTKHARSLDINATPQFLEVVRKSIKRDIRENPDAEAMIKFGTPVVVDLSNNAGLLPTRNFQTGVFPDADKINSDALVNQLLVKHTTTCFSCSIGCRNVTKIKDGEFAGLEGEGPEYETLALGGSNLAIGDIRVIMKFNDECSRMGIDTISAGNVIGWAMELYERGLITKTDTQGLDLSFGNGATVVALPEIIATRKGIGDLLAEGVARAAQRVGKGSERYAMHSKGQEYPAYDPRGSFGMALAYATADRGADHNRAWPVAYEAFGKLDPFTCMGKAELVVKDQIRTSVKWSMCSCDFIPIDLPIIAELLNAATGQKYTEEDVRKIGRRIWTLTRLFNTREGFSRQHDGIPPRIYLDPLPDGNPKGRVLPKEEYETMLTEYYKLWGWDAQGKPTLAAVEELGLTNLM